MDDVRVARRAQIHAVRGGWRVFILEKAGPDVSPRNTWLPIFYKVKPTWEAALAWATSVLEEYYLPEEWSLEEYYLPEEWSLDG